MADDFRTFLDDLLDGLIPVEVMDGFHPTREKQFDRGSRLRGIHNDKGRSQDESIIGVQQLTGGMPHG